MKRLWQTVRTYFIIYKQRQHLLSMNERERKDLAISRVDAEKFAGRYKKK